MGRVGLDKGIFIYGERGGLDTGRMESGTPDRCVNKGAESKAVTGRDARAEHETKAQCPGALGFKDDVPRPEACLRRRDIEPRDCVSYPWYNPDILEKGIGKL